MTDRRLWKHYLPVTSLAGGNYVSQYITISDRYTNTGWHTTLWLTMRKCTNGSTLNQNKYLKRFFLWFLLSDARTANILTVSSSQKLQSNVVYFYNLPCLYSDPPLPPLLYLLYLIMFQKNNISQIQLPVDTYWFYCSIFTLKSSMKQNIWIDLCTNLHILLLISQISDVNCRYMSNILQ